MKINAADLTYILDNTPPEQNIMLSGKHGIGKSRILEEYFASKGQKVVTLFLGQMADPGDLIGLPEKNEETGKTDFMLPYWFPTDGKPIVLFLDELNRARPELMQSVMDLTLNRKLAGKKLPEGSRIISAVNSGNEYQLTDLDPALVSRFNIYEFAPTVEDWLNWAAKSGIDERVISFISANPEYLDCDNFTKNENLERTPDRRSWERSSNIIKSFATIDEKVTLLLSGILGDQTCVLFTRFVNENKIPSAKKILMGDFEKEREELKNLGLQEFAQVNTNVLRFVEAAAKNESLTKEEKNILCKNLILFFEEEGCIAKEIQSHFISLLSAKNYPETLIFVMENCPDLYSKIMAAIED